MYNIYMTTFYMTTFYGHSVDILYSIVVSAGARMGFSSGWEVPLWFAESGSEATYEPSFFRTNWQKQQLREYQLITNKVAVADLSSFGKFRLTGHDARKLLDIATANNVPRPGRTVLSHMLTSTGKVSIVMSSKHLL